MLLFACTASSFAQLVKKSSLSASFVVANMSVNFVAVVVAFEAW